MIIINIIIIIITVLGMESRACAYYTRAVPLSYIPSPIISFKRNVWHWVFILGSGV